MSEELYAELDKLKAESRKGGISAERRAAIKKRKAEIEAKLGSSKKYGEKSLKKHAHKAYRTPTEREKRLEAKKTKKKVEEAAKKGVIKGSVPAERVTVEEAYDRKYGKKGGGKK
jgi:hypothetical protein